MSRAADRLREIVNALPEGSSVTLQRATLEEWLEGEEDAGSEGRERISDFTVQEVAEELDRSPSCIRTWLGSGELDGYKLNGREWRIPRESLQEFRDRQRAGDDKPNSQVPSRRSGSLSDWRGEEE